MRIVIGGASGFLGTPLVAQLRAHGHGVVRLVRSGPAQADSSVWDPARRQVDQSVIDMADVVVNLSGSPISQWPRTASRRREILTSRLGATTTLAEAVATAPNPPALISGSGMSWYGVDRGHDVLTEAAGPGDGFLAEVAQQWEAATQPAIDAGARVCLVRTSIVLDADGGALKLMLLPFKLGAGARLGSGRQHMSLVSRDDWVRAVTFLVEHDEANGAFNIAQPEAVTNRQFTRALGRALHRPAVLAAPSFVLKAALGGLADDLLGSLRLTPQALEEIGFTFDAPDLESTLRSALG